MDNQDKEEIISVMTSIRDEQDKKQEIISVMTSIRDELYQYFPALDNTYPIVEMSSYKNPHYLGYTHFKRIQPNATSLAVKRCQRIEMKMRSKEGEYLSLIRLLPTLIHELAHAYREHTRAPELNDVRRKKVKKMGGHHSHDDGFYRCFEELLFKAEDIGIFSLPPRPNKFGLGSLRQFDKIDLETCPLSFCGTSTRYGIYIETDVWVIVTDSHGKQKPILLKERTLSELLNLASIKLNSRPKPKKAITLQGQNVDDEFLRSVMPQTKIKIL